MALTDTAVKNAKCKEKPYKKYDDRGLFLLVTKKAAQSNRDGNNSEVVAREWFAKNEPVWSPSHSSKIIRRLERDIFPWLGGRPISEITPPELLKIIQKIENRGVIETAHRSMQNCGQVFRFAVASGRADRKSVV